MMKNYMNFMKWAVISMIDRSTQDDHKSKIQIAGLFQSPVVAEDSFMPHLPNQEIKRYCLHVDDLDRFEQFYNFIQDLNEEWGDYAIFHLDEGEFSTDEENRFRNILGIWANTKLA